MNSLQGVIFFGIFSLVLISATEYEGEDFLQGGDLYGGGHESGYESGGHGGGEDYDHHPQYQFEYTVHDPHTHDYKTHHEVREGDTVKGYYTLKEADGSLREVHYTADHKNGFRAVVTQNGKQIHPHVETGHKTVISHGAPHYQESSNFHDSSNYQDASHYY